MALILSACVLQDTMSSQSPLGFRLLFLPYGEEEKGGCLTGPLADPLSYSPWPGPLLLRDGHVESLHGIRGRATPSVRTSVFWPANLSLGDPKVQKTSQSLKVLQDGDSMCREHFSNRMGSQNCNK